MNVNQYIKINASKETIFSFLIDVDNRNEYIPALERVILIDPLPLRKGSRYTEIAVIAGRQLRTTYQITELEENQKIKAKTLKSIFPIEVQLLIKESSNQSILNISLDFELKGIFKLASGIVKGIVQQQTFDILSKIKQKIEQL